MEIQTLAVGPLGTNCYILNKNNTTYIIDPGGDAEYIISNVKNTSSEKIILLTHAHIDHIAAVKEIANHFNINKIYLHKDDIQMYKDPGNSLEPFLPAVKNLPEVISEYSNSDFEVIHTPGHTKGSVCFYFKEDKVLISGDTLFNGGIGRTDFPGGSYEVIISSIKNKIITLPAETVVYPGHGPKTTIKREKISNPFF